MRSPNAAPKRGCRSASPCGAQLSSVDRAPDGSYFGVGYVYGSPTIGGQPLTATQRTDALIVHFSRTGEWLGARTFGGEGASSIERIAIARDGTMGLAGTFSKGLALGGAKVASRSENSAFAGALRADGRGSFVLATGVTTQALWMSPAGETCIVGRRALPAAGAADPRAGGRAVMDAPWTGPLPADAIDRLRTPQQGIFRCYDVAGHETRAKTVDDWRVDFIGPMTEESAAISYTRRDPATHEVVDLVGPLNADFSIGAPTELLRVAASARVVTPFDPRTQKPVGPGVVILGSDAAISGLGLARSGHGTFASLGVTSANGGPRDLLVHVGADGAIRESLVLAARTGQVPAHLKSVLSDRAGLPVVIYRLTALPSVAYLIVRLDAAAKLVRADVALDDYDDTASFFIFGDELVRVSGPTLAVLPNF